MSEAKNTILRAASELFLKGGLSALSVRAISKQAGVSTIGIYSHFNGKQGILDELYIEGFEMVFAAMNLPQKAESPTEVILKGVAGYLDVAEQYEAHYRLIFGESDSSYVPSKQAQQVAEKAFFKLVELSSVLLPTNSHSSLKQKIALEIWALVHGYVSLQHHTIGELGQGAKWRDLALSAVDTHIGAIMATYA
jgi:AcrR family transcriptional regulator